MHVMQGVSRGLCKAVTDVYSSRQKLRRYLTKPLSFMTLNFDLEFRKTCTFEIIKLQVPS